MANKRLTTKSFPLLNEINKQIHLNDIDWNKNAFETLLVRLIEKYIFFFVFNFSNSIS